MIDSARVVEGVIRSVLAGRRKPGRRAWRYLAGRTPFGSTSALITAAGLAWGVIETLQGRAGGGAGWGGAGSSGAPGIPGHTGAVRPVPVVPPPLPGAPPAAQDFPEDALRMIRLAVSAGSADGALGDRERAAILEAAREQGAGHLLDAELASPRPLPEIVAGVTDPAAGATLYVLAFTVVRADESVNGAERIYLAQLAHLLGLDPATVQRLEQETAARIDGTGDA